MIIKKLINVLKLLGVFTALLTNIWAVDSNIVDSNIQIESKIQSIYSEAIQVSGKTDEMGKRSVVLLDIYHKSRQRHKFALAISHLTLAIERSSSNRRIENILKKVSNQNYYQAWIEWGAALKNINKEMVSRFYFAYHVSELLALENMSLKSLELSSFDHKLQRYFNETRSLFGALALVHSAKKLDYGHEKIIFEAFVNWEHREIIQPGVEKAFLKLPRGLKYFVRNVPGVITELPARLLFKARTTLSLKCFKGMKFLRTKDFMNVEHRIVQARRFYNFLEQIDFNKDYSCYQDSYYITKFPDSFKHNPKEFSHKYVELLLNKVVKNSEGWIKSQYQNIPLDEFLSFPSFNIPIIAEDRLRLRMSANPISRNKYINHTYYHIGRKLKACLGVQEKYGNWYHFAGWASQSAGEVISGAKFKGLNLLSKSGVAIGNGLDLMNRQKLSQTFGRINNIIAMEMIPLGRLFLESFCGEKELKPKVFFSKLNPGNTLHDKYIRRAFYLYYLAVNERDLDSKHELVTMASTYQVMGEQVRIDQGLKKVFDYKGSLKLGEYFFKLGSTMNGAFTFGRQYPVKIPLIFNVRTEGTGDDLRAIENDEYIKLLSHYGFKIDLKETKKYKNTGTHDWSNLRRRLQFLVAMFRTYITSPGLQEYPNLF